ncbi:hypothetical protein BESB_067280 [Besnoitia besnoiti]|uniref:Uncharacterized protein n=1 Tax=Besnoitia besnoiti TaxID=94643 RepID=A0A2A9M9L6_BESBE|nr:hypothetical protein BESB_067280 [Besnoitia besnoiti]PFH34695.1 hypothetical protein BESB_067280 [Besnoitia besnoiti]
MAASGAKGRAKPGRRSSRVAQATRALRGASLGGLAQPSLEDCGGRKRMRREVAGEGRAKGGARATPQPSEPAGEEGDGDLDPERLDAPSEESGEADEAQEGGGGERGTRRGAASREASAGEATDTPEEEGAIEEPEGDRQEAGKDERSAESRLASAESKTAQEWVALRLRSGAEAEGKGGREMASWDEEEEETYGPEIRKRFKLEPSTRVLRSREAERPPTALRGEKDKPAKPLAAHRAKPLPLKWDKRSTRAAGAVEHTHSAPASGLEDSLRFLPRARGSTRAGRRLRSCRASRGGAGAAMGAASEDEESCEEVSVRRAQSARAGGGRRGGDAPCGEARGSAACACALANAPPRLGRKTGAAEGEGPDAQCTYSGAWVEYRREGECAEWLPHACSSCSCYCVCHWCGSASRIGTLRGPDCVGDATEDDGGAAHAPLQPFFEQLGGRTLRSAARGDGRRGGGAQVCGGERRVGLEARLGSSLRAASPASAAGVSFASALLPPPRGGVPGACEAADAAAVERWRWGPFSGEPSAWDGDGETGGGGGLKIIGVDAGDFGASGVITVLDETELQRRLAAVLLRRQLSAIAGDGCAGATASFQARRGVCDRGWGDAPVRPPRGGVHEASATAQTATERGGVTPQRNDVSAPASAFFARPSFSSDFASSASTAGSLSCVSGAPSVALSLEASPVASFSSYATLPPAAKDDRLHPPPLRLETSAANLSPSLASRRRAGLPRAGLPRAVSAAPAGSAGGCGPAEATPAPGQVGLRGDTCEPAAREMGARDAGRTTLEASALSRPRAGGHADRLEAGEKTLGIERERESHTDGRTRAARSSGVEARGSAALPHPASPTPPTSSDPRASSAAPPRLSGPQRTLSEFLLRVASRRARLERVGRLLAAIPLPAVSVEAVEAAEGLLAREEEAERRSRAREERALAFQRAESEPRRGCGSVSTRCVASPSLDYAAPSAASPPGTPLPAARSDDGKQAKEALGASTPPGSVPASSECAGGSTAVDSESYIERLPTSTSLASPSCPSPPQKPGAGAEARAALASSPAPASLASAAAPFSSSGACSPLPSPESPQTAASPAVCGPRRGGAEGMSKGGAGPTPGSSRGRWRQSVSRLEDFLRSFERQQRAAELARWRDVEESFAWLRSE